MQWTEAQREVFGHLAPRVAVRGPAGSGRTSTLVERWRHQAGRSLRPDRMLVLCRSRDAADRFRQGALAGRSWAAESLTFTTFYGLAFDLVRRHGGERRLLGRAAQWNLVRRMLAEDGPGHWPSCPEFVGRAAFVDEVADAVVAIEGASDEVLRRTSVSWGQGERWDDLLAFRRRYQRATTAAGVVDWAQLVTQASAIAADPAVAAAESARWDEVLIDDADLVTQPMGALLDRLDPARVVAAGDDQAAGRSWARWRDAAAWVSVTLDRHDRPTPALAQIVCRHPSVEPEAIAGVLLDAHEGGVAWRDMAVLMRSERRRAQGIGRALGRHGIPVRLTPGSSAAEPAVRTLVDFFAWAGGDPAAFDRLLVSPALDIGPGELRLLRRQKASGVPLPSLAKLVALRDAMAPRLGSADPAQLAYEAWIELLGPLVPDPDDDSPDKMGSRAVDALASFLAGMSERAAGDPTWRMADELALIEGPEFDADPWTPIGRLDDDERVTLTSIRSAAGRTWDTVVIAGCLEGELPRVSGGTRFFDPAMAGQGSRPPTLGERRMESLEEERRLFAAATSRARRRLVATAAPAPGQVVSRFLTAASAPGVGAPSPARPLGATGGGGLAPATETDGIAAISPDGRLSLSASRLTTYDDCPLRYFYQYALGVRGPGGVAASMGTVVHSALALFLEPGRGATGDPGERSWAALEGMAQSLWQGGWRESIAPYQPMRDQAERDIFAMLLEWWRREAAQAEATGAWPDVFAVEYPFTITVAGHRIRGSIDRIDRVPGGIAIVDYKTGSKVPRPEEAAEDLQLATYHLAAERDPVLAALGPPLSLELHYLRAGQSVAQPITADHAERTEQRIVDTANRILAEEFEPSLEAQCDYCDFWRLCPLQVQGRQVGGE